VTSIEMKITSTWKIIVLKTHISVYIHKYIHTSSLLLQSQIYVAVVEALRKKERQDETQFTIKIAEKTSLSPS
jgi:hypothetical protein